jgi:hypothetical protein
MSASERVETEESCCHGHLGVRFGLGGTVMASSRRKSCIVSLIDVASGVKMTVSITVVMTGGETS